MSLAQSARPAPHHTLVAVLGPTNTGKTTLAIDRMLASPSGMIGLPLRLLAREVYAKVVARIGEKHVALITGEEKIKPPGARYWICTVEAMPLDIQVSFLAIDEVQIASDLERGHIFTDRILNRRGRDETMLLGAGTMRGPIERLLPDASIITRPRLSTLTYAGSKKLTRLPRRSAIVAFSADEVYAIAELIRRQVGGAAVVLGALSPRTRNAQVALYESGDVDYLVATDAIGMGLNLDVEHVAFAGMRKFDGYQFRNLNPVEMAQIAGRAGRSNRDGTFGTTGRCEPFDEEIVQALESHAFDGVKMLQWRNAALDFSSVPALRDSLDKLPGRPGLTRAPIADDQRVLELVLKDEDIAALAKGREAVEALWNACLMPDYRKISPASHGDLVATIFRSLRKRGGIPDDWLAAQVAFADRTDGDIDTLSTRIAHIRTWTFAANRPDWVRDPAHWQGVTRAIEEKLSDALHERLTQRFVDRRTSVLMRRLRENTMLEAEINRMGEVTVEGQHVGRLEGFQFTPDPSAGDGDAGKALRAAAAKALASEFEIRAERLSQQGDEAFILANDGLIRWQGEAVARLTGGDRALSPRIRLLADEQLTGPARDKVQARLDLWIAARIEKLLGPVTALEKAEDLQGLARGVAFQVAEHLGIVERQAIAKDIKELDQEARAALRKYGLRFGAYHIYLPATLKPAPRALALQLHALHKGASEPVAMDELPHLAASGRTSIAVNPQIAQDFYRLAGFRALGPRAVRIDILERLADLIRPALAWRPLSPGQKPEGAFPGGGFVVTVQMTSLLGCSGEDFAAILKGLGYRMDKRPAPPPEAPKEPLNAGENAEIPAETSETADESTPASDMQGTGGDEAPVSGAQAPDEGSAAPFDAPVAEEPAPAGDEPVAEAVAATDEAAPVAEGEQPATEPALVEVWRPGGRMDGERPRREHGRPHHRGPRPAEGAAPGEQQARGPRRDDKNRERPEGEGRPAFKGKPRHEGGAFGKNKPEGGFNKPKGEGFNKDRRDGGKPFRDRNDRPQREERGPRVISTEAPRGKTREPDPDSPFAKLMALKAQMEKK